MESQFEGLKSSHPSGKFIQGSSVYSASSSNTSSDFSNDGNHNETPCRKGVLVGLLLLIGGGVAFTLYRLDCYSCGSAQTYGTENGSQSMPENSVRGQDVKQMNQQITHGLNKADEATSRLTQEGKRATSRLTKKRDLENEGGDFSSQGMQTFKVGNRECAIASKEDDGVKRRYYLVKEENGNWASVGQADFEGRCLKGKSLDDIQKKRMEQKMDPNWTPPKTKQTTYNFENGKMQTPTHDTARSYGQAMTFQRATTILHYDARKWLANLLKLVGVVEYQRLGGASLFQKVKNTTGKSPEITGLVQWKFNLKLYKALGEDKPDAFTGGMIGELERKKGRARFEQAMDDRKENGNKLLTKLEENNSEEAPDLREEFKSQVENVQNFYDRMLEFEKKVEAAAEAKTAKASNGWSNVNWQIFNERCRIGFKDDEKTRYYAVKRANGKWVSVGKDDYLACTRADPNDKSGSRSVRGSGGDFSNQSLQTFKVDNRECAIASKEDDGAERTYYLVKEENGNWAGVGQDDFEGRCLKGKSLDDIQKKRMEQKNGSQLDTAENETVEL